MKIALIGAGGIAGAHLPGLTKLGDVRVYSKEGTTQLCESWGISPCESLAEALDWCDVVDICTPTHTHYDIACQALEAGKDVICEKPLCRRSDEARQLIQKAEACGKRLFPAHVVRYFPPYAQLKSAVESGSLGDLAVLRFTRSGTFPHWSSWFGDYEKSGGLIMDLMIHDIDQATWLAGPVTSVYATQTDKMNSDSRLAAAHCILTHSSGAISYIRGLWGAKTTTFETSFHVSGSHGYVSYDSSQDHMIRLNGLASSETGIVPASTADDPYGNQLADFVSAIDSGSDTRVKATDGLYAVYLAELAQESINRGTPIDSQEFVS